MNTPVPPRIVVGVDGSPTAEAALRWAVAQAELTGAGIDAVMSWRFPVFYGWDPGLPASDFSGWAEQALTEALDKVRASGTTVTIRPHVLEGDPALVLLDEAAGADLLVVGSRGHGGVTSLALGSVSHHCAQHAECPVVIVRHDAPATA